MLSGSTPVIVLLSLLGAAQAASSPRVGTVVRSPPTSPNVATILATGDYFTSGSINANLIWQASGVLTAGGCGQPAGVTIESCYKLSLTAQGQLQTTLKPAKRALVSLTLEEIARRNPEDLDAYFAAFPDEKAFRHMKGAVAGGGIAKRDTSSSVKERVSKTRLVSSSVKTTPIVKTRLSTVSTKTVDSSTTSSSAPSSSSSTASSSSVAPTPTVEAGRQRTEVYSWPGAAANERWTYQWKTWARPGVSTSVHFSHAWQMLRRDLTGGPVVTLDYKVDKVVIGDIVANCTACAVRPLQPWLGIVVQHDMSVTWGVNGTMTYSAADVKVPNVPLIAYGATHDMGSSASIKFGMYRIVTPNATDYEGVVGDYVATRLA